MASSSADEQGSHFYILQEYYCRKHTYATVAMDRRTKEMVLPDTLEGALKHPEYFVCTCKRVQDKYIVEEITQV